MRTLYTIIVICLAIYAVQGQNNVNPDEILPPDPAFPTKPPPRADLDEFAIFPGGQEAFWNYLQTIPYPEEARGKGLGGKIFVKFTVDSTGHVVDAHIVKGLDPILNEAAISHFEQMPVWEPAKKDGKPVSVTQIVPVKFNPEYEDGVGPYKFYNAGEAYFLEGNYFNAAGEYEKVLSFYEHNITMDDVPVSHIYYKKALCLHYLKQHEAACTNMKQAKKLGSEKAAMMVKEVCK